MFEPLLQPNIPLITAEEDVRRYFGVNTNIVTSNRIARFAKLIVTVAMIIGSVFVAINAPAFLSKGKYIVTNDIMNSSINKLSSPSLPLPGQTANASITQETKSSLLNNHLYIDRIGVNAPINWDVNDSNDTVMTSLESGVVQLEGTAKPGEKGNIFIVGHSSNYSFAKGKYKTVFALLPELVIGDNIVIQYNNVTHRYRVSDTKVVSPNDVGVKDKGNTNKLTLMTCVPLGTSLKRLVVVAEPINGGGIYSPQLPTVR